MYIKTVSYFSFILWILEGSNINTTLLPSAVDGIATNDIWHPDKTISYSSQKRLRELLRRLRVLGCVGTFLFDPIPILKYVPEFVPGAGFPKQARIWRKLQEDFRERPYIASVEAMVSYSISPLRRTLILFFRPLAGVDLRLHQTKVVILLTNER